jgi:hypothetical protein
MVVASGGDVGALGVGFEEDDLDGSLVECASNTIGAGGPSLVRSSRFNTDDVTGRSSGGGVHHTRQRWRRQQRRSLPARPGRWQRHWPRRVCPQQRSGATTRARASARSGASSWPRAAVEVASSIAAWARAARRPRPGRPRQQWQHP